MFEILVASSSGFVPHRCRRVLSAVFGLDGLAGKAPAEWFDHLTPRQPSVPRALALSVKTALLSKTFPARRHTYRYYIIAYSPVKSEKKL